MTRLTLDDFNGRNFREKVDGIKPVSGFCWMVDIVGSTSLKDNAFYDWVFELFYLLNRIDKQRLVEPLKIVGDMVMYWCSDPPAPAQPNPLPLFQNLFELQCEKSLQDRPEEYPRKVKIAVCRCENVREFGIEKNDDVYGKDIDLTARLLSKAGPGEIVMDQRFYKLLSAAINENECHRDEFDRITGPDSVNGLKGFSDISVYRYNCSGFS